MSATLIVIPARMASTRLPGKPLADIAGAPMIVHVWRRAMAAGAARVVVATDTEAVAEAVRAVGGEAVMTRADHESGSDRVFEAVSIADPQGRFGVIVNLQGDLPTFAPGDLRACMALLDDGEADIATLVAEIRNSAERDDPNVVKMIGAELAPGRFRALYFTRAAAPHGDGPLYHHIGVYAYRRGALERFVALPPSPLERRERLEQLRALEAGMAIRAGLVDSLPIGVDTPADLAHVRRLVAGI